LSDNDPQVSGEAIAALTALGFSNIRIEVPGAARASFEALRLDHNEEKFDTIVCPGGKEGVEDCFFGKNKWRWVRVDPRKLDSVKYVAIYETVLDAENNNATGGRGEVIAYAPVLGYHKYGEDGDEDGGNRAAEDKYCFDLGEIVRLERPISSDGLSLRNLRYTRLEDLLKALSLAELFKRRR
jgi:hypothetical protein